MSLHTMCSITSLALCVTAAGPGLAQPPAAEAPGATSDLDAPPPSDALELFPEAPAAAPSPPVAATPAASPISGRSPTIAERGGLFGLGLSVAPKLGGGLGALAFEGLGGSLLAELELGYAPPLLSRRELQVFSAWSYAAPATSETIEDARVPGGAYQYTLTLHQLVGTHGVLYRVPLDVVEWWRPTAAAGLRTSWSWTSVDGSSQGAAFGTYTESAFELGVYGAVGSDFYVGPGAIVAELQLALSWADRFVIRSMAGASVQLALGYRFYL